MYKKVSISYVTMACFSLPFEASQVIWDKGYNDPRKKGGNHSMTY